MTEGANGPRVRESEEAGKLHLACSGDWTIAGFGRAPERLLPDLPSGLSVIQMDLSDVSRLDTAGAAILADFQKRSEDAGLTLRLGGLDTAQARLFEQVQKSLPPDLAAPARPWFLAAIAEKTGRAVIALGRDAKELTGFFGQTVVVLAGALLRPQRIRWTALVSHMEQSGLNALPIVGLISFLIGLVMAYQGADQLQRFGAEIFTINLVAIGVLREMAILLTAIIVAGRSGSAFTAQIGTMKVNEEVDALRTIGLDPFEVLVLPRVLALILVLPLLTFYADIMGLLGGAVMVIVALDMNFLQYLRRLGEAITLGDFAVGMIKAPLFAGIIALVGCFEGFRVSRSAESVGRQTTRAVVEAVFLVIVLDAGLSIFFSLIGL
jgi:phospholipid/cholesterol/gamma-HCH transport system permease protein